MTQVWRCRVCEAVNQGGRTCSTCGAVVPAGEPLRAAVRTRLPTAARRLPAPVPPTPPRREARRLPPPEELVLDPFEFFGSAGGWDVRPMPGGCLVSSTPRRRRRRRSLFWP